MGGWWVGGLAERGNGWQLGWLIEGVAPAQRPPSDGTTPSPRLPCRFKEDCADNKHARALQHHGYGGGSGGAHFTMSGSKQFHKGVRIKGLAQRKAGKAKEQAARNKANRGNSSVAVKR